jgi:hypothetical protein
MVSISTYLDTFAEFRVSTWDPWRKILGRLTKDIREAYFIVGRGGGKSRISAALATYFATQVPYKTVPGERIYIGVIAPDRKLANIPLDYIRGLLKDVPAFEALIESETADSIRLTNNVTIEVVTASTSAPRGRSYALVILEEAAFFPDEKSSNPDVELLNAVEPALARVPGSLLVVISSPHLKRGILYDAWLENKEHPRPELLVVQAPTLELNPGFDQQAIARKYKKDQAAAAAEYGAEFRDDIEGIFSPQAVDAVTAKGIFERTLQYGMKNVRAFVDPATGSGTNADSFTLAIAATVDDVEMLLLVREFEPPFSPESTVTEIVELLQMYQLREVHGDRFSGQIIQEQFQKRGIVYNETSGNLNRSGIYLDFLTLVNSGGCSLLDIPKLRAQILGLERKVRTQMDLIDHKRGFHDDVANAAAGAVVVGRKAKRRVYDCTW